MKITVAKWYAREAQTKAGKYCWSVRYQMDAILKVDGDILESNIREADYEFNKDYVLGYSFFGKVTRTTEKAVCLVASAYAWRGLAPREFTLWVPKSAILCVDGVKFSEEELQESMDAQTADTEAGIVRC